MIAILPGSGGRTLLQQAADQQHARLLASPHNTPTTPYRAERWDVVRAGRDETDTETGEYECRIDFVPELPAMGQPVHENVIYRHDGGFVIARQDHDRTEHEPEAITALFTVWRPDDGDVLEWVAGELVEQGQYRRCPLDGQVYRQQQPGPVLTVEGQEPSSSGMGAVWLLVEDDQGSDNGAGEITEWAPGQTVAVDDLRLYEGTVYRCRQGHTTQPGWEPPNVPALWEVYEEGSD